MQRKRIIVESDKATLNDIIQNGLLFKREVDYQKQGEMWKKQDTITSSCLELAIEKCIECDRILTKGLGFYVFMCHSHAICGFCIKAEDLLNDQCYVCNYTSKQEELKKRHIYEARNALPLVSLSSINPVKHGPISKKYEYASTHSTPSIHSVTYMGDIDIHGTTPILCGSQDLYNDTYCPSPFSCWPAGYKDSIIIGGIRERSVGPTISVVHPYDTCTNICTHVMGTGDAILSGVHITECIHLVCVEYNVEWMYTSKSNSNIHVIRLDPTSTESGLIVPLKTFDNIQYPMYLFPISRRLYGVLATHYSHFGKPSNRIYVLGLPSIIPYTNNSSLQSTCAWGKRVLIHLSYHFTHPLNSACATPRGEICLLLCGEGEVRVYSRTGAYRYTISKQRDVFEVMFRMWENELDWPRNIYANEDVDPFPRYNPDRHNIYLSSNYMNEEELFPRKPNLVQREKLPMPKFIQCTADGTLVVSGRMGQVLSYKMDKYIYTRDLDVNIDMEGHVHFRKIVEWELLKKGFSEEENMLDPRVTCSTMISNRRYTGVMDDSRNVLQMYNIQTASISPDYSDDNNADDDDDDDNNYDDEHDDVYYDDDGGFRFETDTIVVENDIEDDHVDYADDY